MFSELTVIARFKAKPGREADLERELRALVGPTHKEPGCLRYVLHRSVEDVSSLVMVERWVSKAALDRHLGMPYIRALFQKMDELTMLPPELILLEALPEGSSEKGKI